MTTLKIKITNAKLYSHKIICLTGIHYTLYSFKTVNEHIMIMNSFSLGFYSKFARTSFLMDRIYFLLDFLLIGLNSCGIAMDSLWIGRIFVDFSGFPMDWSDMNFCGLQWILRTIHKI